MLYHQTWLSTTLLFNSYKKEGKLYKPEKLVIKSALDRILDAICFRTIAETSKTYEGLTEVTQSSTQVAYKTLTVEITTQNDTRQISYLIPTSRIR